MEWLFGIILGAIISSVIGGIMGSVSTLGAQWFIRYFARKDLPEKVETAYLAFQGACEPNTLNPDYPGNPAAMKAVARNHANILIKQLRRAGFDPPPACNVDSEENEANSLLSWFKFLASVRIQLG